ncbi:hypothetical protein Tco_0953343 [Tanacetum coccineum]|uniref:Uncharacterized protein n=1 Tax=Tanacetum coccineum TaxID=301880 RepID=A0ABQ5E1H9_9ASTR
MDFEEQARFARGIVLYNNKARLVHRDTDKRRCIDSDELTLRVPFLYGEIEEEVYVHSPQKAFEDPYFPKHVRTVPMATSSAKTSKMGFFLKTCLQKFDIESIRMVHIILTASRPDKDVAVSGLFKTSITPLTSHLNAVKKIFNTKRATKISGFGRGDRKSTTVDVNIWAEQLLMCIRYCFCCLYYESAGSLSFLLDEMVSASYGYLLVPLYMLMRKLLLNIFMDAGSVCAANTSIYAADCAQFDIAGRLVSTTSHLISAGSIQSCWWNNVSAA